MLWRSELLSPQSLPSPSAKLIENRLNLGWCVMVDDTGLVSMGRRCRIDVKNSCDVWFQGDRRTDLLVGRIDRLQPRIQTRLPSRRFNKCPCCFRAPTRSAKVVYNENSLARKTEVCFVWLVAEISMRLPLKVDRVQLRDEPSLSGLGVLTFRGFAMTNEQIVVVRFAEAFAQPSQCCRYAMLVRI